MLDAIYIQKVVKEQTGRNIPLLKLSSGRRYPIEKKFNEKEVCTLLKKALAANAGKYNSVYDSRDAK